MKKNPQASPAKPSYSDLERKNKLLQDELSGQRSIEKVLWRKQDQLFKVLDSLDAIVYVADMNTYEVLFANRHAESIFGPLAGKTCWKVLQSGLSGPCPFCNNEKLVTPDNTPRDMIQQEMQNTVNGRWYTIRDRAIEWFDGRIVHLQIAVDITHQKETESALKYSEKKFRTVADFTYDWEYWISNSASFNYISPSCERITGYSVEEFEKNPDLLLNIIHPDDRNRFEKHLDEELDSLEVCHMDFRIISKSGKERWVSHYCQPVLNSDSKVMGRRASNRDISLRKKAEQQLKLDEIRLSALLKLYDMQEFPIKEVCDFALDVSLPLTKSKIGFMGFLNDKETHMTVHSWSKKVMADCKVHDKPLVFSIAESGVWGEAVRKRQPVIINDYNSLPARKGVPAGHVEIIRFMAVPLIDKDKIIAVMAVGNKHDDYTDQDAKQVKLLLEGMWQIIRRRQAEEELINHARLTEHFANTVSHDLKNPAIAIDGLTRILKRKHQDLSREKLENFIDQIARNAEQIVALSDDINTFISTSQSPMQFALVDLKEIWKAIREEFYERLKKRKVKWSEEQIIETLMVADENQLLRVYRNLVDNALKHAGSGLTRIALKYELSETHHILGVENDGKAIPRDECDSIFEIYSRADSNSSSAGTGLGLAIVREIAQKHRGYSWVESSTEGTTTFYVSIALNL